MSFSWRLSILFLLMAVCGTGLTVANRSPVVELPKPEASPYYISDGQRITVPPGFSLERDAAAQRAYQADWEAQQAARDRY